MHATNDLFFLDKRKPFHAGLVWTNIILSLMRTIVYGACVSIYQTI